MVLCNVTTPAGMQAQEATDTEQASGAAQLSTGVSNGGKSWPLPSRHEALLHPGSLGKGSAWEWHKQNIPLR